MPKDNSPDPAVPPEWARDLDRISHAAVGRWTGGLSPTALAVAGLDWGLHLAASPSKQAELTALWLRQMAELTRPDPPLPDPRFRDPAWQAWPYAALARGFLAQQRWWEAATTGVRGLDAHHADVARFTARQVLDAASPANNPLTNPVVQHRTIEERGQNLIRGAGHWAEDLRRLLTGDTAQHPDHVVGETLATTPGEVVLRTPLAELIRYAPTTDTVRPEPVLIVPAWIMKYYILDLSPGRSLVAWLRDQGYEVHILSWRNPDAGDAGLGMQDYLDQGPRAALDHLSAQGAERVHLAGYCLGGTLAAICAAAMARDGDDRLATLTLLAAQVDFTEAGELTLFVDDSEIAFLEDVMAAQGFLRADQMAGTFRLLRSGDLIWSRVIRHYLLGERTPMNDLMAWNADATRMPARMHGEYLRGLFLENRLAHGHWQVDGRDIALTDIRAPIFCLATETDHVSPWRSVHNLHLLTDTELTFVLTSGGHNGGVVSEPGHAHRHYRIGTRAHDDTHVGADAWLDRHAPHDGSWWPAWAAWLDARSGAAQAPRPAPAGLDPAPGLYVRG